jgi:hypothetical protein
VNLSFGNIRTIAIVCAVIVIGILFYYLLSGAGLPPMYQRENVTTTENITPVVLPISDVEFEIQEANVSIVKYINSTPVSFKELQIYPELEGYMHGVNNDREVWHQGWRLVTDFTGNLSQYNDFINEVCKGKTRLECNGGMLLEYHNQYYKVTIQQYGTLQRNSNY